MHKQTRQDSEKSGVLPNVVNEETHCVTFEKGLSSDLSLSLGLTTTSNFNIKQNIPHTLASVSPFIK